jgi:hypothetical protein
MDDWGDPVVITKSRVDESRVDEFDLQMVHRQEQLMDEEEYNLKLLRHIRNTSSCLTLLVAFELMRAMWWMLAVGSAVGGQ